MGSSQMQKPQRASGDKATLGHPFLLDLSDNTVVSLYRTVLAPHGSSKQWLEP